MLVADYGSDDSDNEVSPSSRQSSAPSSSLKSSLPAPAKKPSLPAPSKKSTFSLPPPSSASASTASKPLPGPKPKKAPKKIAIDLPSLPADDDAAEEDARPPAKKPRLDTAGAGSSSLFSMLPVPKQKTSALPAPKRVLGDGQGRGLVFNTSRATQSAVVAKQQDENGAEEQDFLEDTAETSEVTEKMPSSLPFLPPSLAKGKANISLEDTPARPPPPMAAKPPLSAPAIDFFSLSKGTVSHN